MHNRIPFNSKCYLILLMWVLQYAKACHLLEELCNSFSKMTVKKSSPSLITGLSSERRHRYFFSPVKAVYIEERAQRTCLLSLLQKLDLTYTFINNVSFSEFLTQLYLFGIFMHNSEQAAHQSPFVGTSLTSRDLYLSLCYIGSSPKTYFLSQLSQKTIIRYIKSCVKCCY